MTYYCIMVLTGEEKKFKERAQEAFKDTYPDLHFYFFESDMYTKKRGWFKAPLFPGYLFFGIEELTSDFLYNLRSIKGFCRILRDNNNPLTITGKSLDELSFLISYGEVLGISKIEFREGQQIRVISGPLKGHEWEILFVNKKKKEITVQSFLSEDGKKITFKFEQVERAID